ncbi:MAG TPA: sigma-70 family RNA polymerase sigma factor [Propionicimonas sp.]|jgi:RNA polymerase sigma-70 factor (ECF subfamily)
MRLDAPDDRALVDAALGGDADAFRVLVERNARLVVGVCARVLGDPAEAEDVAQEAFLRAYDALATYRGDGAFGAWVTRIAVRRASSRLAARRQTWSLDDEGAHAITAETMRSEDDLELGVLDAEARRALWSAVADLPAGQREAVALRFAHDLSIDEIAVRTDTPVGTVKSRLHRAMHTLRERLGTRPLE